MECKNFMSDNVDIEKLYGDKFQIYRKKEEDDMILEDK